MIKEPIYTDAEWKLERYNYNTIVYKLYLTENKTR